MLEDDEQAQVLVTAEPVVGPGRHEERVALAKLDLLSLDVEHAAALEGDVDLVVVVRLLAVGLGCNQDVDADLEARGGVHDLVPAGLAEPLLHGFDVERARNLEPLAAGVGNVAH